MWEFLQTPGGIAMASAFVAALSMVVAGFAVWVNYFGIGKRLDHDERMQKDRIAAQGQAQEKRLAHEAEIHHERLAHERIEAVRLRAAQTYVKVDDALGAVPVEDLQSVLREDFQRKLEGVTDTLPDVKLIRALGNEAMWVTADGLIVELERLVDLGMRAAGAIRAMRPDHRDMENDFKEQFLTAVDALAEFRDAISE